MSARKSYNRFFIIFQEEDKGYGISPDRPPTGYAKIETRNDKSKVTMYVQNLKFFESAECLYKCYLISHQDDKDCTVYLGIMNIDELGRGESTWESGSLNAFNSKTPIEKFNGAAVVAERKDTADIIAPLAGYMSKEKFEWRYRLLETKKQQKDSENKEDTAKTGEAKKFDEYEQKIKKIIESGENNEANSAEKPEDVPEKEAEIAKSENKVQESHFEETPAEETPKAQAEENVQADDRITEDHEVKEEAQKSDEQEREDIEKEEDTKDYDVTASKSEREDENQADSEEIEPEEEIRTGHKNDEKHKHYFKCPVYGYDKCVYMDYYKSNYRQIIRKMLEDILEDYEKVGKHGDLKDCTMWKVTMDKYKRDGYKMTMYPCYDLVFYPMMYNPMFNYYKYIRKSGHYIFGIKYDGNKNVIALLYGIHGRNIPPEQPYEGKTGFMRWISGDDHGDGYWIMIYDPITGKIM
ncbi:MAG: hypothetical protein QME45_14310 [Clostridiales bacterium]|nr:hypothetical protein [Clostridiales bacterium]